MLSCKDLLDNFCSWGESAGAISVALQMLANGGNTEGLFRGGFMQSGAPTQLATSQRAKSTTTPWLRKLVALDPRIHLLA